MQKINLLAFKSDQSQKLFEFTSILVVYVSG